ncbi:two-component regulator propeller domain-containing protein, partial [uncultured Fluviicola sp.]|uniref:ligand-binding sensor domain-containing protein n=1 Tax=uncultured Fluviicola sp. TaxID=463303 RepID=UPI0025F6E78C
MLNKWIIYCLLLISASKAYSQKLVFENLGVKQGLPAMEVYNLHQDSRGYVWVFTEYGIVKHNGTKFVPVCKNIPLKESAVYGVTSSQAGEMYIANSKAHVYRIANDRAIPLKGFEEYTRRINKTSQPVLSLLIDSRDKFYLSYFGQTFVVPKSHYKRTEQSIIAQKRPISAPKANQLFTIRKNDPATGKLYISIADRLGNEMQRFVSDSINMSRSWSYEFNGNTYLSFLDEIRLFRKNGTVKVHRFKNHVINYKIAPNGHVWIALGGDGLWELDEELNPVEHYLDNMIVSDVLIDNQSGMWVSTIGDGIYYCPDVARLSFWNVNGLNGKIRMLKRIGDKVFIGTEKGKLFVRGNHQLTEIYLKDVAVAGVVGVNDIVEFEKKYYVGTRQGIYILDEEFKLLQFIRYSAYSFLKNNDSLLFTTGSCIYRKRKGEQLVELVKEHSWNRILVERNPGEFFINLADGLYRFKKTFSDPTAVKGFQKKNISRIKLDSEKNIWICTKGDGLYCLTPANKLL